MSRKSELTNALDELFGNCESIIGDVLESADLLHAGECLLRADGCADKLEVGSWVEDARQYCENKQKKIVITEDGWRIEDFGHADDDDMCRLVSLIFTGENEDD